MKKNVDEIYISKSIEMRLLEKKEKLERLSYFLEVNLMGPGIIRTLIIYNEQIKEIENVLSNAIIIERKERYEFIEPGSMVFILNKDDKTTSIHITGYNEYDRVGDVPYNTPIGKTFLGKKIGDTVFFKYRDEDGKEKEEEVEILAIF